MMMPARIKEMMEASRMVEIERLTNPDGPKGDFEGSVTGYWVKLQQDGTGLVSYRGKNYVTKPMGDSSIRPGMEVELTYARTIYYSKW